MDHIRFTTASIRYGRPYFMPGTRTAQVAVIGRTLPELPLFVRLMLHIQGHIDTLIMKVKALLQMH